MKSISFIIAVIAVVGLVLCVGNSVGFAEDIVRIESYVESIPGFTGVHKYLPNYCPNWQPARDLGKARVTIETYVASIPGFTGAHRYLPNYCSKWQLPTMVEVTQPHIDKYTAQVGAAFVYVEPELYIDH